MTKQLKQQINQIKKAWGGFIVWGGVILILFFSLRLFNLTLLPVFADEAIYLRWSQVMWAEPTLRFLPLSDGKQPLFMWLTIPFLKFIADPLFAGRFLSVLSGLGSMVGLGLLSWTLFKNKQLVLLTAFFYCLVPYFFFFDRMALVDSMLAMFSIWIIGLGVWLVRLLRLDLAMVIGMILGAGLLTKSPAIIIAALLPTTLLVSGWLDLRRPRRWLLKLIKGIGLWLIVYGLGFGIYNILRLGPNFHMIKARNQDYVFSLSEILSHPLDPLRPHLGNLAEWLPNLFTWPILILAIIGLYGLWQRKQKASLLFLLSLMLVPLLIQSSFAKVFTPRYLLFSVWPIIIFASWGFETLITKLKIGRSLVIPLLIVISLLAFSYDWRLLTTPEKAPLPIKMRTGYLEEWTAGQGLKEVAGFIRERAQETTVFVGTEGYFGTLPDGLQLYLEKVPNVTVTGVGYPLTEVPESLVNSLVNNEVYLVVNQSRRLLDPTVSGLKLIAEYPKAVSVHNEQDKLLFYQLEPEFWQAP